MIDKALMWLAQAVLTWMALKLQKKVVNLYELAEEEKAFEETNKKNVEKYNAAKDRLEKIKAAADLLNRA
jgi:hypothetical protein